MLLVLMEKPVIAMFRLPTFGASEVATGSSWAVTSSSDIFVVNQTNTFTLNNSSLFESQQAVLDLLHKSKRRRPAITAGLLVCIGCGR